MDNIWSTPIRRQTWSNPTFDAGDSVGQMLSKFLVAPRGMPYGATFGTQGRSTFDSGIGGANRGYHGFGANYFDNVASSGSATDRAMEFAARLAQSIGGSAADAMTSAAGAALGQVGASGDAVDQANPYIQSASAKFGVPAGLLKTIINNESSGDWAGNGYRYVTSVRPSSGGILPFVGIFENAWQSWGCPGTAAAAVGNEQAQVDCLAQGLKGFYNQNPQAGWDGVITMHFAGETAPSGWQDENGMTDYQYLQSAKANWARYDAQGASSAAGAAAGALGGGVPTGNAATVLNEAKKYVGVPYVWGAIPGKGQDPRSSGWDCSGFTYWLDQNYGTGQLPEGSHYQYQYAQQTGKLFTDTSQLQPGDLLFFNTGPDNGGGAELNSAGHVAIYLGNGQIIQAANPSEGTVISDFSGYYAQTYIGAMHMSWSGGTPGGIGSSIGGALTSAASGATSSAWTPYASWGSDRRVSSNPYASWGR